MAMILQKYRSFLNKSEAKPRSGISILEDCASGLSDSPGKTELPKGAERSNRSSSANMNTSFIFMSIRTIYIGLIIYTLFCIGGIILQNPVISNLPNVILAVVCIIFVWFIFFYTKNKKEK